MKFDKKNLYDRVLSSLVLAPLVVAAVYADGSAYITLVSVIMTLALYEWVKLVVAPDKNGITLRAVILLALGTFFLVASGISLVFLRAQPVIGMALVYYLLAVVWGTDIGAFLAGKLIGGPKLAVTVSPNKTWAGLFGGIALAVIFGYGAALVSHARQPLTALGLAIVLAAVAQCGDLLKSRFKRRAGVKDSGTLIPGHGGILDRIDGLVFAAVVFALFEMAGGLTIKWW